MPTERLRSRRISSFTASTGESCFSASTSLHSSQTWYVSVDVLQRVPALLTSASPMRATLATLTASSRPRHQRTRTSRAPSCRRPCSSSLRAGPTTDLLLVSETQGEASRIHRLGALLGKVDRWWQARHVRGTVGRRITDDALRCSDEGGRTQWHMLRLEGSSTVEQAARSRYKRRWSNRTGEVE